jgi:hypothetical protein
MNDELEGIWNEAVATLPRYYPRIWLQGQKERKKITKSLDQHSWVSRPRVKASKS